MAELLGFVEPFSSHVSQQAPVAHRLLQVPAQERWLYHLNFHLKKEPPRSLIGWMLFFCFAVKPIIVQGPLTGCAALRPSLAPRLSSAPPGWSPAPPLSGNSGRSWSLWGSDRPDHLWNTILNGHCSFWTGRRMFEPPLRGLVRCYWKTFLDLLK